MSIRSKQVTIDPPHSAGMNADVLREEICQLRDLARTNAPMGADATNTGPSEHTRAFDALTDKERDVATLGITPGALKPLKELNEMHFKVLESSNALSTGLARQLGSYRAVAEGRS